LKKAMASKMSPVSIIVDGSGGQDPMIKAPGCKSFVLPAVTVGNLHDHT